ncbi:MAG: ATP-dependent DNA helicase [Actinomycetota bacterium]
MADDRTVLEALTTRLPGGGERRSGQLDMAEAVATAIDGERHLVVAAGTGTGKSLAYLVPVIRSGKRAIVATATKALQDQLADKDVPFLAEHLDEPVVVSVLKGRSNYLCRQRLAEMGSADDDVAQAGLDLTDETTSRTGAEVRALLEWAEATTTGDRAELPEEPSARAWSAVSVTPRECPGAHQCPSGDTCFAEDARSAAQASQVVIVNTHLYAMHLATAGAVLPEHEVVVIDEAHQLEDVISSSAGVTVGPGRLLAAGRGARRLLASTTPADNVEDAAAKLTDVLVDLVDQRIDRAPPARLRQVLELTRDRLTTLSGALSEQRGDDLDQLRLRGRMATDALREEVEVALALPESHAAWVEGPRTQPNLRLAPIDVGELLGGALWPHVTAVLTSATIPDGLAGRLGMDDDHDELDVGSPFDYEAQGLLYCARHLPEPRAASYPEAMHDELAALIEAAGGRTMALFTSWRAMQAAAEEMTERLDLPVLAQGELAKATLVERFTADEEACLFATMGFWQGVDVPGMTLSLVTIDKIPFPRPDDPLLQARRERAGRFGFAEVDLPRAAMLLAQGAGRLIRSAADRGVVAVLDRRLATAGYRWDLVNALPPLRRTRDPEEVRAFLRALRADASVADRQ